MKKFIVPFFVLLTACESYKVTETINSEVQVTNVERGGKGSIRLVIQQFNLPQTFEVTVTHCSSDVTFAVGEKIYYPLSHRVYDDEHSNKNGYYYESTYCEYITQLTPDN
jgi:hypothetical protein